MYFTTCSPLAEVLLRMRRRLLFAAWIAAAGAPMHVSRAQDSLRVLSHTPTTASPSSIVTVTFDRPIAGAMDTLPPSRVFRIAPDIAGTLTWRDPTTIRFVPSKPLQPGTEYTVTIDTSARAVDGSRLGAPFHFSYRVTGPQLLLRSFDRFVGFLKDTLAPDGRIELLYSAPVDLARLAGAMRIELTGCPGAGTIAYHPLLQRPLSPNDPIAFRQAGGYQHDSIADRFRSLVELEPVGPLPVE